jgi:tetratricopeptide (TPR) repeat protein
MASPQNPSNELTPAMQQALRFLEAGKTVEAEETVLRAAEEIRGRFGAGSRQDAVAQNELGSVLLHVGQVDRAIAAFRESVSGGPPGDEPAMRDRLTFLMNLGQTLQRAGRLDEAEEVLQKGLEGRESFYGRKHGGYAFGLEPLAEVTFRVGKKDVALDMMNEVVGNFWTNGHPRVAGAIAIRAAMLKAAGKPTAVFGGLEKLPDEIIADIGKQVVSRIANTEDLNTTALVMSDLVSLLNARLGEGHAQTINALITLSNVQRKLGKAGDPAIRRQTIRRLMIIFDSQGRAREALQSVLALALAYGDAGEPDRSVATYENALVRVERLGDLREKSQVLRNYGLLLAELKRDAEAGKRLREAVAEGRKSDDKEMIGRSLVALGIYLQHGGKLEDARPLLAEALTLLDPAHPDSLTCRSHLQAIDAKGSCGCGDMSGAMCEAFSEFVMSRMPAGLLKKLDVTMKDGDFSVGVHLDRKPTDAELEHLHRVTQHALEEFRRRIGRDN